MVLNASTLTPGVERAIPDTRFQALGRVPDERPSACVRAVDAALAVPKLAVLAERIGGPLGRVLVRGEALLELFCRLEISTLPVFGAACSVSCGPITVAAFRRAVDIIELLREALRGRRRPQGVPHAPSRLG